MGVLINCLELRSKSDHLNGPIVLQVLESVVSLLVYVTHTGNARTFTRVLDFTHVDSRPSNHGHSSQPSKVGVSQFSNQVSGLIILVLQLV